MAQTHIIADGVVVNSIMAAIVEAQAAFPGAICIDAAEHGGGVGWTWDGLALTPPPPNPDPVPAAVTGSQGQLALLQTGNLAAVREHIAGLTEEADRLRAEIEFGRATWERANPFLISLWLDGMGRTEEELDALFKLAATL